MSKNRMGRFRDKILEYMKLGEPYFPTYIADAIGTIHKTVIRDLVNLSETNPELMGHKKYGRVHTFRVRD